MATPLLEELEHLEQAAPAELREEYQAIIGRPEPAEGDAVRLRQLAASLDIPAHRLRADVEAAAARRALDAELAAGRVELDKLRAETASLASVARKLMCSPEQANMLRAVEAAIVLAAVGEDRWRVASDWLRCRGWRQIIGGQWIDAHDYRSIDIADAIQRQANVDLEPLQRLRQAMADEARRLTAAAPVPAQ